MGKLSRGDIPLVLRKIEVSKYLIYREVHKAAMRTLIATDGSKEATTAICTASRLLRKSNSEVHLLCVAPELHSQNQKWEKDEKDLLQKQYRMRITEETKSILKQAHKILHHEGIDASTFSDIGSPARTIIQLASEYDVTVVGAKGRYTDSELALGPVASRVIEHAPGTVLVARELISESNPRILLGVDGSMASKNALNSMLSCFNLTSAEITLIHVIEMPWIHIGLDQDWLVDSEEMMNFNDPEIKLEQELRSEAEDLVERIRARLERYSCSVMTLIEEGNPATEILGEAERGEYDLIILGATGLADTKHAFLGSVSAKVARQAPCSVAVVKYSC
jgi:nucleotide-binding universal stress UspA family protein